MSAFNTVSVKRLSPCPRCEDDGLINLQFAYGDTQQLHYEIGDTLTWGGNDIGDPNADEVLILGTPEYCYRCGLPVPDDYVLVVKRGRLVSYRLATPNDLATLE